jgi:hypothetical protein
MKSNSLEPYSDFLAARAISLESAQRFGLYAITTAQAQYDLGFQVPGPAVNLSGLALPITHPRTGRLLITPIRPDHPVVVNGQPRKYLWPTGCRNHLIVPDPLPQQLDDVRFAAILTESAFKAYALKSTVGTNYLIVGMNGVWG